MGKLLAAGETVEFAGDAGNRRGVPERGSANLNGGSAGDEEFGGVESGSDAAQADDRNPDGFGGFVDKAECKGLDGGTREPAKAGADAWAAGGGVDGESDKGINEGNRVGARILSGEGERFDACDVGGEFDDEGAPCCRADSGDELGK